MPAIPLVITKSICSRWLAYVPPYLQKQNGRREEGEEEEEEMDNMEDDSDLMLSKSSLSSMFEDNSDESGYTLSPDFPSSLDDVVLVEESTCFPYLASIDSSVLSSSIAEVYQIHANGSQ